MKTVYLKCKDVEVLNKFLCVPSEPIINKETGEVSFPKPVKQNPNIIGYIQPQRGVKAQKAITTTAGIEYPAQEQIGDPEYWYTCVQFKEDKYELSKGIQEVDEKIGKQIVGVWAGE